MKAAALLVSCLESEGVRFAFGIPGEENLELMDALRDSSVRFVLTRHEGAAAFMADVYGRLTGRAGVCLATLGPGSTNLVTGVADAFLDRAPLVAITAQADLTRIHRESEQVQDVDVLVGLAVDPRQVRLGRDRDERSAVEERIRHAGHEIRRAGSQGREADAGPAGEAAVDVGHERRGSFVSSQDEPNRTVAEGVHQLEVLLPRDSEGEPDAFTFQTGDEERGGFHADGIGGGRFMACGGRIAVRNLFLPAPILRKHGDGRLRLDRGHADPLEGALDPMEDESQRPGGGPRLEAGANPRGRDSPLPPGPGAPLP